tara:strand:+ start:2513 stop:2791 length:279 start_codon:yes stop_codon:yes gene_type:complete
MTNEMKAIYINETSWTKEEIEFFNDMFQDNEPTEDQLKHQYQLDLIDQLLVDDGKIQDARIYVIAINDFVYVSNDKFIELQETDLEYEYAPF